MKQEQRHRNFPCRIRMERCISRLDLYTGRVGESDVEVPEMRTRV